MSPFHCVPFPFSVPFSPSISYVPFPFLSIFCPLSTFHFRKRLTYLVGFVRYFRVLLLLLLCAVRIVVGPNVWEETSSARAVSSAAMERSRNSRSTTLPICSCTGGG